MAIVAGEVPVVLLVRPGRMGLERQVAACEAYFSEPERRYRLVATAHTHADAVALVFNGVADVVVAASAAKDDARLEALLARVNGRFEVCRPQRPRKSDLGGHTEEIVRRMGEHGGTTEEIGRLLGVDEGRVRGILRRIRRNPR